MKKDEKFIGLTSTFIDERIHTLLLEGMFVNKPRSGQDSINLTKKSSPAINVDIDNDYPPLLNTLETPNLSIGN